MYRLKHYRAKLGALLLIFSILGIASVQRPQADAVIIGGPCCVGPIHFASAVMREYLEDMWDEPGEIQADWLRGRLAEADYDYVLALRAAVAGHCIDGCDLELAVATETLNDIIDQRYQERETHTQIMIGGLGALWTLVVAVVTIILGDLWHRRRLHSHSRAPTKRPLWLKHRKRIQRTGNRW